MRGNWSVAVKKDHWEGIGGKLLKGLCGPKSEEITEGKTNCMMKSFVPPILHQLLLLAFQCRRISSNGFVFSFHSNSATIEHRASPERENNCLHGGFFVPWQRFQS